MNPPADEEDGFAWMGPRWREVEQDEHSDHGRDVPPTPPHRSLGAIDRGSTTSDTGPDAPPPAASDC